MAAWEQGGVEEADARTQGRKGSLVPRVAMEIKRRICIERYLQEMEWTVTD